MSAPVKEGETNYVDFFEITNFGDEPQSVMGFRWRDGKGGVDIADGIPFETIEVIGPRETIILAEWNAVFMSSEQQFRDWWGSEFPSETRIIFYDGNNRGLSRQGDSVRIWGPGSPATAMIVARADFGEALDGHTFTYDSTTGEFGVRSSNGVDRAYTSAGGKNVGSPGVTTSPIAAIIIEHPTSIATCAQARAVFRVRAGGMPPPRIQWFSNDVAIAGETSPTLTITNPLVFAGATIRACATNFLATEWSSAATLTIYTNPGAPVFMSRPATRNVFSNDLARFEAQVCSWPPATFQWYRDNAAIDGATQQVFEVRNAKLADSNALFTIEAKNAHGTATAEARLFVRPKPLLKITEIFAFGATNCARTNAPEDWFEICNCDSASVDLLGYRFANYLEDLEANAAFTNIHQIILQPGECAIFVRANGDTQAIQKFINWWAPDALPAGLVITTFSGFGFSNIGDSLHMWTPDASGIDDPVHSDAYSLPEAGVSKSYSGVILRLTNSTVGVDGAYRSLCCNEVASPGYIANPPPRISVSSEGTVTRITCRTVPGRTYQLEAADAVPSNLWAPVSSLLTASNAIERFIDPGPRSMSRFYRVREVSP